MSESPIEKQFRLAWKKLYPKMRLVDQYKVGRYRLDFAYPSVKVAVELDGWRTHSSTTDIANDRRRQRELERLGWRFIRFGGQEVYRDPAGCCRETHAFILSLQQKKSETASALPSSPLARVVSFFLGRSE